MNMRMIASYAAIALGVILIIGGGATLAYALSVFLPLREMLDLLSKP